MYYLVRLLAIINFTAMTSKHKAFTSANSAIMCIAPLLISICTPFLPIKLDKYNNCSFSLTLPVIVTVTVGVAFEVAVAVLDAMHIL